MSVSIKTEDIDAFSVGYFEERHQTKHWLCDDRDIEVMYEKCSAVGGYSFGVRVERRLNQQSIKES